MSDGLDLEGEGICHSSVRNEMENKQPWWSWRRRAAPRTGNEFDAKNGTREIELRKMWPPPPPELDCSNYART